MSLLRKIAKLPRKLRQLPIQVIQLENRMSVVDGRSSLNAERNVRTHASLQNLAEDLETVRNQLELLMAERTPEQQNESEDT